MNIEKIWDNMRKQDNIIHKKYESNGEVIESIQSLDGSKISMKGKAKHFTQNDK